MINTVGYTLPPFRHPYTASAPLRVPQRTVSVYFQQIMHHTIQFPLDIHLLSGAQTESVQSQCTRQVSEHRFYDAHSSDVLVTPFPGVDLLFHEIQKMSLCPMA